MTITQTSRSQNDDASHEAFAAGSISIENQGKREPQTVHVFDGTFPPEPTVSRAPEIGRSGVPLDDSHLPGEAQKCAAVVDFFPPANVHANPTGLSLAGTTSESQGLTATHSKVALGTPSPDAMVAAGHIPTTRQGTFSESQLLRDYQTVNALGTPVVPDARIDSNPIYPTHQGPLLYSGYLCLLSDSLDGIEDLRIATENRVRSLTRTETDKDGELRGLGLDVRSPEVARAMAMLDNIKALEKDATKELQREVRKSPLYGWVKRNSGIGEKQAARLFAVIGDPYWNDLYERPRTVSELWAYSGYSVQMGHAQRRTKGQKSNWNDKAKSRAFLMATSCIKRLDGYYRSIYDLARIQYVDALHPHDCVRCGPAGKPASAGTPLSLGHQHARALRRVSKEILKDLWLEARAIHEGVEL